jgi:hypothetical protein
MVRWGDNKAVRYLEVVVYAEGGRKGIIWLLEGREGRGQCWFVRELRQMLVPFQTSLSCRVLLKFQGFFVWGVLRGSGAGYNQFYCGLWWSH